jgi:hypothetical protein
MCDVTKKGIKLYKCDRTDEHSENHHFQWQSEDMCKDTISGKLELKTVTYDTWW